MSMSSGRTSNTVSNFVRPRVICSGFTIYDLRFAIAITSCAPPPGSVPESASESENICEDEVAGWLPEPSDVWHPSGLRGAHVVCDMHPGVSASLRPPSYFLATLRLGHGLCLTRTCLKTVFWACGGRRNY